MKAKLDFSRHNLLFLFTSNRHPASSRFIALRFQYVCLCGSTHRGTSTKISLKKNRKEKKTDHRKFHLCSVCNSFPHSTSLLILDFNVNVVVFYFFLIMSSIPILHSASLSRLWPLAINAVIEKTNYLECCVVRILIFPVIFIQVHE